MDDDFALIDFALTAAPPEDVATALGQLPLHLGRAVGGETERGGLVKRLFRRGSANTIDAPLLIQPRGSLSGEPLVRTLLDDVGAGASERQVRLSAPIGSQSLTLIEFREDDSAESPLCAGLSGLLRDSEVFYFRVSGARHPGAQYRFHVYQNGLASRRSESYSPRGTAPEAPWDGVDAGIFHPLETDCLVPAEAPRWALVTPERQGSILEALGVAPERLFTDISGRESVLVLSPAKGGLPLSEVAMHTGPRLRGPASFAPGGRTSASEPALPAELPPVPSDPAAWEAEVTGLLVKAVGAALPEAEQVPWLESLTAQLNAGNVTEALEAAGRLIAQADLPSDERDRMVARLIALFAPPETS